MDLERDTFEARLDDPEWVAAEFAAILSASGLLPLVGVAVSSREPRPGGSARRALLCSAAPSPRRTSAVRRRARVRSPPM
ncbi:hypothetical protein [Microbacterium sp. P02]|uniref:hypothetical protein n=1 Tax=Microbacterium sp. P02 TaxID=3366260 RepID=UPI003672169B